MGSLQIFPLETIPEVRPGDDLAGLIAEAAAREERPLADGDVLVVTQKVVSKAENCLVAIDPDDPLSHKPLVEAESVRILRRRGDLIVSETRHGFVCANAGIDLSNIERGYAALLPEDSTCRTRGGAPPPPPRSPPPDPPAASATACGTGPASRWRSSSPTPS